MPTPPQKNKTLPKNNTLTLVINLHSHAPLPPQNVYIHIITNISLALIPHPHTCVLPETVCMHDIINFLPLTVALTLLPHTHIRLQAVCIQNITYVLPLTVDLTLHQLHPFAFKLYVFTKLLVFHP